VLLKSNMAEFGVHALETVARFCRLHVQSVSAESHQADRAEVRQRASPQVLAPVGLGTDTGTRSASVIAPELVGIRSTMGLSVAGRVPLKLPGGHRGPITARLRTRRFVLAVIAGPDASDRSLVRARGTFRRATPRF